MNSMRPPTRHELQEGMASQMAESARDDEQTLRSQRQQGLRYTQAMRSCLEAKLQPATHFVCAQSEALPGRGGSAAAERTLGPSALPWPQYQQLRESAARLLGCSEAVGAEVTPAGRV